MKNEIKNILYDLDLEIKKVKKTDIWTDKYSMSPKKETRFAILVKCISNFCRHSRTGKASQVDPFKDNIHNEVLNLGLEDFYEISKMLNDKTKDMSLEEFESYTNDEVFEETINKLLGNKKFNCTIFKDSNDELKENAVIGNLEKSKTFVISDNNFEIKPFAHTIINHIGEFWETF